MPSIPRPALLFALAAIALSACSSEETSVSPAPTPGNDAATDEQGDQQADALPADDADAQGDAPVDASAEKFQAIADRAEQERAQLGAPGVAIAIVQKGQVTWSMGLGSKDPNGNDPVHDTTLFRIGSVNKMLTATALLRRVEAGQIDLQQPVTTYLPTLSFARDPSWAPSITVWNLLTHTSGIVDYLEVDSALRDDSALSEYLLGTFAQQEYLMVSPGRFYNYTNPGYMYAGLVTETVAGRPYRIDLKDSVLSPLAMNRTFLLPADVLADGDYALGKTVDWNTGEPMVAHPDTYDNAWARPAGYAWSSVLDLAKFVSFLAKGDSGVLSDALRNDMTGDQVNTEELLDLAHYGFGVASSRGFYIGASFYETRLLSHSGAIPGFAADLYYLPACDLGFITLANTDGAYFTNTLVHAITTLCDLPTPSANPPDISVDPSSFDDYVGDYRDDFNAGQVTLSRVGDELHISIPLADAASIPYGKVLTPVSPRNFLLDIQGTQLLLTVIVDDQGKGEYLRTRAFVAARQTSGSPPTAHGPSPASLRRALSQAPAEPAFSRLLRPNTFAAARP
jgi:CubicO group peptidase (beta-lactamase class C family)